MLECATKAIKQSEENRMACSVNCEERLGRPAGLPGLSFCGHPFNRIHHFLGGLSLHLNHLIGQRLAISFWQFGTLLIGIFLSNLDSRQLKTSLMTSYCHF